MKKLFKILLATVLTVGAFLSMPPKAAAENPWCRECDNTDDCFACCVCDGGAFLECDILCNE